MALSAGTQLGPFEIGALVGAGGMGEVYRARDTRLDRTVAIKILSDLGDGTSGTRRLERFRQEARSVARLTHPNIGTLYDVCEEGLTTYLVMEFIDGETLARRLDSGALPLAAALKIAIQIADALDHAHREGVTHRDLKPANIMLARDRVKLLDFGLARLHERDERSAVLAETDTRLTEAQAIVGTAPYMAPEQIEGQDVDARTDLFAFGIVLYEMIAGRRPFAGDSRISLLAAIVGADPPPLSGLKPGTPPALERLVARCLAKHPDDRWQTARDLAAELRWIAESGPATSVAQAPARRRRRVWLTAGGLAAAAGAAALATRAFSGISAPSVGSYSAITFRHGIVSSARFTSDRSVVFSASWDGRPYEVFLAREGSADARALGLENGRILSVSPSAEMAVLFGRQIVTNMIGPRTLARVSLAGGARRDLLEEIVDADWIPGTNDLAIVRMQPDGPWHVEFPIGHKVHEAAAVWSLRVSPDGQRIAFFEGPALFGGVPDDMVSVVDRAGNKSTLSKGWSGMGLAWAPSGREVWFTASRGPRAPSMHAVSLGGTLRSIHAAPDWLVLHDIAPDGQVLVARNSIKWTLMCQPPGEAAERELTWLGGTGNSVLSADGRTVVFQEGLYGRQRLPVIFQRDLSGTPAVRLGEGAIHGLSPDGRWALVFDTALTLVPIGAGSPRVLDSGAIGRIEWGHWFPDGKRIALGGRPRGENTRARIWVQDVDGGPPRPITPETVSIFPQIVAPDGRAVVGIAFGETESKLYPVDGGSPRPFTGLVSGDRAIAWSADGATLYAMTGSPLRSSRDVIRIDVATGRRSVWKTLGPPDRIGVDNVNFVTMTPDASAYCYAYMRRLGSLFTVDGLR